jgi:hypothetical protein
MFNNYAVLYCIHFSIVTVNVFSDSKRISGAKKASTAASCTNLYKELANTFRAPARLIFRPGEKSSVPRRAAAGAEL